MSLPKPPVFWILSDRSAILVLAVVGGFVASAGYIKLFGLFVTSITGNLVVATTSGFYPDGGVVPRVLVMVVFAAGAVTAKVISFRLKYKLKTLIWNTAILLFACEAIMLLLAIAFGVYIEFWGSGFEQRDSWQVYVQASLLAFAMGIHNAASLEVIENCPATTMVTSTFVKIAMSAADTAQFYASLKGCADYDYNGGETSIEEKYLNARATFCSNFVLLVFFVLGAVLGAISVLYIGFWCLFAPLSLILIIITSVQLCKMKHNAQQVNGATSDVTTAVAENGEL